MIPTRQICTSGSNSTRSQTKAFPKSISDDTWQNENRKKCSSIASRKNESVPKFLSLVAFKPIPGNTDQNDYHGKEFNCSIRSHDYKVALKDSRRSSGHELANSFLLNPILKKL